MISARIPSTRKPRSAHPLRPPRRRPAANQDIPINTERGLGLDGAAIALEEWDATFGEAYRRVGALLDAGRDVAFDSTAYTREQRDVLRGLTHGHGAHALVVFVDVPTGVSFARWRENRRTGARFDVRDEDFLNVVEHFEPPGEDERALRYDGTEPVEAWVRRELAQARTPSTKRSDESMGYE